MGPDQGIPTSALLQTLKERGYRVSYPTFIKWRQEDLIPDPLPDRAGRGYGLGREEARWSQGILEQVDKICRLRQGKFRFDEIALELWLSGFTIPAERVRQALLDEWARFLGPFETKIYPLRQKLVSGDDDSAGEAVERLARKLARRRPRYATLPPRERRATVTIWRQMLAIMVLGVDRAAEIHDGQSLTMALGLPDEFAALMQQSQEAQWLRGSLNERALAEVLKDPVTAVDLLARVLPQARFLRFVAELPESLTDGPTDWARMLRFMKQSQSVGPRPFSIGMLLIKMARGGEAPGLSDAVTAVEALAKEISQASPGLAVELMSAAQKIIPQTVSQGATEKRR